MLDAHKNRIEPEAGKQDLWRIAEVGDRAELQQALTAGADVNCCDESGVTPLMIAAGLGRLDMVTALIEAGAQVNSANDDGLTAAMLADDAGHDAVVRLLVSLAVKRNAPRQAPVNPSDGFSQTEVDEGREDLEGGSRERAPAIRTLHEPPDIWDLVHETPSQFKPGSAFFGHFTRTQLAVLTLIMLAIAAGGIFWFTRLPAPKARPAARPPMAESESNGTRTILNSPPPASSTQATISNEQPKPVNGGSTVSPLNHSKSPLTAAAEPKQRTLTPPHQKRSPGAQDKFFSDDDQATVPASTSKPNTRSFRSGNRNSSPTSEASLKSEGAKISTGKKEEGKAPGPQPASPPKANPTPKAKVIQWP